MVDRSYHDTIRFCGILAKLAYKDKDEIVAIGTKLGLDILGVHRVDRTDSEFFVVRDPEFEVMYVATRGTEPKSLRDIRIDSMAIRRRIIVQDTPMQVHRGFYKVVLNIGGTIAGHIADFPGDAVWLTGHSAGGSVSSGLRALLPWNWRRVLSSPQAINAVRFASARFGCPTFAAYSDGQPGIDIRVELEGENGETVDPVCGVPGALSKRMGPIERYRHAGTRLGLSTRERGFSAHPMNRYIEALAGM